MELRCIENNFSNFFILLGVIISTVNITASFEICLYCDGILKLETDGPAVLDAQLSVKAEIKNAKDYDGPFYFSFNDNTSPMHYTEVNSKEGVATYTLKYPSWEYEPRGSLMTVEMSVRVFVAWIPWISRREIAFDKIYYNITKSLNGHLDVTQSNRSIHYKGERAVVSALNYTKLTVNFSDPHGFLSNANISYFWIINGTNYGSTNGTSFDYAFNTPSVSHVEAWTYATLPNPNMKNKQCDNINDHLNETVFKNDTSVGMCTSLGMSKNAEFRTQIDSRVPMTFVKHEGDVWIKHGKMLNLSVTCDGSGPWEHFWYLQPNSTLSSNTTCDTKTESYKQISRGKCSFSVSHWIRHNCAYSLVIIVDDGLMPIVKKVGINVYTGPRQTPLSFIIVPIMSSIMAIAAFISALFVFFTYKQNMKGRETANFDFTSQGESLEYKSFWERIQDDILNVLSHAQFGSHMDSESESLTSTEQIQNPTLELNNDVLEI